MLRSTFEASVRPISVWSRLHSPLLARKRPTCRLVPAVATFNCHSLHTSRTREMWTQNKTSLPLTPLRPGRSIELGATFVGAGAVRLLHNNNSETPGQPAPAAAASAVERDHGCVLGEGNRSDGFTEKGRYWIERGPTDKDGPGYVYVMSEVDAEPLFWYKIGFTKLDPEVRVAQLAKTNQKFYELVYHVYVKYHKNTEKALLEDLKARGMGLPTQLLPCGKTEPGGTEWVCGEDVIELCKRLMGYIKQLDKKGSRFRK